ncbi:MAG TPA: metallophosphoesterase family protein [Candidatus Omnitrophota bacterium]|nr:metallophosphoesterase family protein [Candidatus Omnitrophota bacterium]HPD83906.1 metallophosphoesterase family protein [Candidatus Omnitrophota bacterium]HRZ02763.1 metallophosphoesterase family protein [Candidatus Omnitrophota bacterium]
MKIGVVSDTHAKSLPAQMLEDFKGVDLILHAGDICSAQDFEQLKSVAEVKAVYGNMDGADMRQILPRSQVIQCGKFSIGLFHGEGAPATLMERVKAEFKDKKVDAIVFGHSHHPMNEVIDGILFFNPGSPNDKSFAPFCSYGILELDDTIKGKIIKVK